MLHFVRESFKVLYMFRQNSCHCNKAESVFNIFATTFMQLNFGKSLKLPRPGILLITRA